MTSSNLSRNLGITACIAALLPSGAIAGTPSVIVSGSFAGIPTLDQNLLIALGVMLAVVGLRFLQQHSKGQKIMSIVLLGGGLLLTGLGVEKTVATTPSTVTQGGSACSGGQETLENREGSGGVTLENGCTSTNLTVVLYQNMSCPPEEQITAGADVGDVLRPGESATMNTCLAPD